MDNRTRGNSWKLCTNRFHYVIRKYTFTVRIIYIWNSLPDAVVLVNTLRMHFSWTQLKLKLWFSVQSSGCHKSTSHIASISQKVTCSSLTTSNCSEWRSTQHFLSTSTLSILLIPITTTYVCYVTYVHSWHDAAKAVAVSIVSLDNRLVTLYYMACRRLISIDYTCSKCSSICHCRGIMDY